MKKTLCALLSFGLLAACQPASSPTEQVSASTAPATSQEQVMTTSESPAVSESNPQVDVSAKAELSAPADASAQLQQLHTEITQLAGTAAATNISQCRKVGVGYRSCGGPNSYLIYSIQGTDEATLLSKVAQYNALQQAESERLGLMSTCQVIAEPVIVFTDGVCQAAPVDDSTVATY
jgi:hypothetical protein